MKSLEPNHSLNPQNLFGLLMSRFLYRGPQTSERPGQMVPHDVVSGAEAASKEQVEAFTKTLNERLKGYNQNYGDFVPGNERKADFYYESLPLLDVADLDTVKQKIDLIRAEVRKKKGAAWPNIQTTDPQIKALNDLYQYIDYLKALPASGAGAVEQAHRQRLHERQELISGATQKRELWEKKPAYKELSGVFDSLASSKDFQGLWQTPDGLSNQKQREAKQLFFAMMAEKTHDFEDTFVLGDQFQNDADANIRNFPFLYNEFLKHEGAQVKDAVSAEAISAAESERELRLRNLSDRDPREVVKRATGAGPTPDELKDEPVVPDTPGWEDRVRVLEGMIYRYEEKAKESQDMPQKGVWEKAATELKTHLAYAKASLQVSRLKHREQGVKSKFTRIELSQPARRKLVMQLAMKQFAKSMEIVDRGPYGNNLAWQNALHPTVRRLLIASVYDGGIGRIETDRAGNETYRDELGEENIWMMSALSLSDYFNFNRIGENLDPDHAAVLKAAYVGSRAALLIEKAKPIVDADNPNAGVLAAWISLRQAPPAGLGDRAPATPAEKQKVREAMAPYPPELVQRFGTYSLNELGDKQKMALDNITRLKEFMNATRKAIQSPYSAESQDFIKAMRNGEYRTKIQDEISFLGLMTLVDGETLDNYERQMTHLQINFKTMELQDMNMLMYFEGLGMNVEGMYPAYLNAIKKDPSLKAEYWDRMLLGDDEAFNKLIALLDQIIPGSGTRNAGGKEDLIVGLQTIRKKYRGQIAFGLQAAMQEGKEDGSVLNMYRMLQQHLRAREESYATSDRQQKDIEARMKGMHVGDRITPIVEGVWNMLAGPGQSMANRAAGLVLMYGFYKSARMAMKGDTPAGKALRALFVAGAVEIATKEITGRGVLDRLGLDSISGAMEGTYEAVLLQDAKDRMDDKQITSEAHAAALMELNDVPFEQLMKWYDNSDPNGMPKKGKTDNFPAQINLNYIGPKVTWDVKNKQLEARRVVYQTVKHFFAYVGDKDNHRDHVHGREALRERWVTMVNKPDHKPRFSTYSHNEWLQAGGVSKSDITWQMVMRCEIDPREVDLTRGRTPMGRLQTAAENLYTDLTDWVRDYVYNPGSGYAQEFLRSLGENAQSAQDFFAEVAKTAERKIYFTKEKAVLWYGAHQYEIRRTAENHWELLVTALKMPFKLVYAVDDWAIPWTLTKLKQIEESLRSDKGDVTDRELDEEHLFTNPNTIDSPDLETNPKFTYFGHYQEQFIRAYRNSSGPNRWFYRDPGDPTKPRRDVGMNVGYFISEVSDAEAGIKSGDPLYEGSPDNVHQKLVAASRKKAEARFMREGMTKKEVEAYMYPIHKLSKTTHPRKVYIFWRMPLKDSLELHLKETGVWADFNNPNRIKDRAPFEVDPAKSSWENLQAALKLDIDPVRKVLAGVGGYAAQVPKTLFLHTAWLGELVKAIGHALKAEKGGDFDHLVDAIAKRTPSQLQFVDEVFTSGKNEHLAMSDFYKNKVNAKLYNFSLDYAIDRQTSLYLGIMEGRTNPKYEDSIYLITDNPEEKYADMLLYYKQKYTDKGKKDQDIERALDEWGRRLQQNRNRPAGAGTPGAGAGAGPGTP